MGGVGVSIDKCIRFKFLFNLYKSSFRRTNAKCLPVCHTGIEQTVWSSVVPLRADHVMEYTESWVSRGLFKKGTCYPCWKSPTFRFWRRQDKILKKTKQWVIIFRSFAILPYHYYSRRLQRYHICNISQGVYEVLLCRRIQTNQIGTMYEPFSCPIWSFANAEQQILPISMLIFTFVLSMLLRWIVLKHSAIWKLKSNQWFLFTVLDGKYL